MPVTIPLMHEEPEARLGSVRVLVVGGSALGLRVVSMLQKTGVHHVTESFGASGQDLVSLVADHDLVINALRTVGEMHDLAAACAETGKPLVWGEVVGPVYRAAVFWSQAPEGYRRSDFRDIYPEVPGNDPEPGDPLLAIVWAQAATVLITEAQKLVQGIGDPLLGRLLECNARHATWSVRDIGPETVITER